MFHVDSNDNKGAVYSIYVYVPKHCFNKNVWLKKEQKRIILYEMGQ